ncbi:MAG: signal peptidase I [Clostridia bacterium]|nr:signal peptidase I [Clostridia bacterium]
MTNKHIKKSKIVEIILNILLFIVAIIMILGIYYIVQIKILKKEYANMFGYTFFEVATGSMSNTIEIGDVVIVKINDNIKENDIIVYKDRNDFITHRLIEIKQEELITKGDANNSEDRSILKNQVLGKVIYIVPKVGIWRKILLTPQILRTNNNCNFTSKHFIYVFSKK